MPEAVHAALFGQKRALDLTRITTDRGENLYSAILAGAGYDALVIRDADRKAKRRLGLWAYLWAGLKNLGHRPVLVRIYLDHEPTPLVRRARSVMVANMGRFQGGLNVIPGAWPHDGRLEVAILKAETLRDWLRLVWKAVTGRLHGERASEYHAARKVTVEFSRSQLFQYDGEEAGEVRAFTAEVVPQAVQVMVPREAPI